jgi:formyl-CoA transferase
MKDIEHDPSLRASGTIVEVEHKARGKYLTVGSPIKFSELTVEITGSPLLGEHSDEVLASLGYNPQQIARLHEENVV